MTSLKGTLILDLTRLLPGAYGSVPRIPVHDGRTGHPGRIDGGLMTAGQGHRVDQPPGDVGRVAAAGGKDQDPGIF